MLWMAVALWGCAGGAGDAALQKQVADLTEQVEALQERVERLESGKPTLRPDTKGIQTRAPSLAAELVSEEEGGYRLDPRVFADGLLANSVRLIPHRRDGEPEGVRLGGIPRDSIAGAAGLKNGDLLVSIDGEPSVGPEALTDFAASKPEGTVTLELLRRDEPVTLSWTIAP